MVKQLTAIIEKENDGYVALFPEVNVAGLGDTARADRANFKEALELLFETPSPQEFNSRLLENVYVTNNVDIYHRTVEVAA